MTESAKFGVLFLGTGVSTAIPNLGHIMNDTCQPCRSAFSAVDSKNRRNNVSIALTYIGDDGLDKCVIVDVGKTMRDGCLHLLPKHNISQVDNIILTHGHADAMFGLDDVRDFQKAMSVEVPDPNSETGVSKGFKMMSGKLSIYLNKETMDTVSTVFGYLTGPPQYLNEKEEVLQRRVAYLDFKVIDSNGSVNIDGLKVRCFPVYHGGTYISLGFSFGKEGEFVYISDVKIFPPETLAYLQSIPKIKILVIDALDRRRGIYSHMGLEDAFEAIALLQPETVYFTGMGCGMGLHEDAEAMLAEKAPNTFLAYDGLYLKGLDM